MQKRLKASQKVEQRDFNNRRFEEDNPFYIGLKTANQVNKYEEIDGETVEIKRPEQFQLNREKILLVSIML